MKFHIITPTYKRPDLVLEAVKSCLEQISGDWRMIIVNNSPSDFSYEKVEQKIENEKRILYVKNGENRGVNFSRNRALDIIAKDAGKDDWIILLDDDDTLAKDALQTFEKMHKENPNEPWLLTNRAYYDGVPITKIPQSNKHYSYISGFLLTKRLKGDATHCIKADVVNGIRFSKYVSQGEEWLFFYELSLKVKKFFYFNHNSTFSFGYSPDGLNFRKRSRSDRMQDLFSLIKESLARRILWHPTILIYFLARFILLFKF